MNDDVFRQSWLENLVPTNHLLSVLLQNLQQARVEVSLQLVIVLDSFLLHEGLNRGIAIPLFTFVLVASDVQILVGEERCHLA